MDWIVYILRCCDGSYYTGITNDILRRVQQHNAGKGAKYTKGRGPVELVYQEKYADRSSASRREAEIKKLTKEQKYALICNSFDLI